MPPTDSQSVDASTPPETADDFPNASSICEQCGYPIRDLSIDSDCPECGYAIADSSPAGRSGLPWQRRLTPWAWLQTARLMAFSPGKAFAMLRLDLLAPSDSHSPAHPKQQQKLSVKQKKQNQNGRARLFLLSIAVGIGAIWYVYWRTAHGIRPLQWAGIAAASILLLTYIEAAGVAWIGRRRGWRLSLRRAERIACYSAIGWIPAGLLMLKVCMWHMHPAMSGPFGLFKGDARDYPWMVSIGAISILWFEWLVWFGCRRLKFANG